MKTIYIAGRMRGIPYYNFPAFFDKEFELAHEGWQVINPAQLDLDAGIDPYKFPEDYDWAQEPQGCLRDIIRRDCLAIINKCDAIYMMKGWQGGRGTIAEHALAEWLGLEIVEEDNCNTGLDL